MKQVEENIGGSVPAAPGVPCHGLAGVHVVAVPRVVVRVAVLGEGEEEEMVGEGRRWGRGRGGRRNARRRARVG